MDLRRIQAIVEAATSLLVKTKFQGSHLADETQDPKKGRGGWIQRSEGNLPACLQRMRVEGSEVNLSRSTVYL